MSHTDLIQLVQSHFERSERELRSITFKSQETIAELLNQVRQQARALAADTNLGVLEQISSESSVKIKNQLAQALANLCPEKYPNQQNVTFFQLQETHQTLAKTIYLEWLETSLQAGGNLNVPEPVPAIRRPGVRVNLVRDAVLKDALGNEMRFQKGERCFLLIQNDQHFLQKLISKKDPNPKKPSRLEPWPHLFPLLDRRIIQESGTRILPVERPCLESPVMASEVYVYPTEKAALHAVAYALARNLPAVIHDLFEVQTERVTVRLQRFQPRDASYEPVYMAMEMSLPESSARQALWVLWIEKALATYKGNYDARFEARELASLLIGRSFRPIDLTLVGTREWIPEQFLSGMPRYIMHPTVLQILSERAAKYRLEPQHLERLATLNSTEIQFFKKLVIQAEPTRWVSWLQYQDQQLQLEAEQEQSEKESKEQYQSQLQALKSRQDLSVLQQKNEIGQLSLAYDAQTKKSRSEFKAKRAQLETKIQQENQLIDAFIVDLQGMTRTQVRQAALESLLKTSMSFTKIKYRADMYSQDFDAVIVELGKFVESNPEIQLDNLKLKTAELLSMLTVYGQDLLPPQAEGNKGKLPSYSPHQRQLFEQIEAAVNAGQLILAGNSPSEVELSGQGQFLYPIVDTLSYQGRLCVCVVHPFAQEFPRYYKMTEGKLTLRAALKDPELAAMEAKMAKALPEYWVDIQDLGVYFRTLYVSQ